MASPKIEVFFVFNETTGAPIPGIVASMSFDTYKKDEGTNVSTPSFVEIGGGAYYFTPVFADVAHGIAYCINTGGGVITPKRITRFMRPEDWTTDTLPVMSGAIDIVRKVETGRWKIAANQLTVYDTDGLSPLIVFSLKDALGNPTTTGSFERAP